MNIILGLLILVAFVLALGKILGLLGETIQAILLTIFVILIFVATLGYAFL